MEKKEAAVIDEAARYMESSKKMLETARENFYKTRLEANEEIQVIIPSDIACVTLSNKRAYFRGKYIGADIKSRPQGDNVNLNSIGRVYLKSRRRKSKTPDKGILVLALFIIVLMILNCILLSNQKKAYREGERQDRLYEKYNQTEIQTVPGYSKDDIAVYFSQKYQNPGNFKENSAIEEVLEKRNQNEQRLADARSNADTAYGKAAVYMTLFYFTIVVCILLIIYTIIRAVKHMDEYSTIQFICDNEEFGIEIRDKNILDQVKNLLLVAKSTPEAF